MNKFIALAFILILLLPLHFLSALNVSAGPTTSESKSRVMEKLGRGLVALRLDEKKVYLSWRMLSSDPSNVAFNVYRVTGNFGPVKLNSNPINETTDFIDTTADLTKPNTYFIRPIINGVELEPSASFTLPANAPIKSCLSIPLRQDAVNFNGQILGARLIGVGDLDGDGEYEFVVKRGDQDLDPSQATYPTHAPIETYKLEAYDLNGTFMWRVDLGPNIRPGIWYSPFVVYDLDCDGRAEVITKIGDGARILTSTGETMDLGDINQDGILIYVDNLGRQYFGPEYFAIIDGATGRVLAIGDWIPMRSWAYWGDDYGNRAHRHYLGIAYVDGYMPSLIVARGTYTELYVDIWNWRNGTLSRVWSWHRSGGGAFHGIRVGDVDGDGRDEIIHGSIAIDDNGATMWVTGQGHGDRFHLTDIDPTRPGLEIWYVQERPGVNYYGIHLRDAKTGELIWGRSGPGFGDQDIGRGLAADIDPRYPGLECWATRGVLYSAKGEEIGPLPSKCNFGIWWDDDLLREHLDGTTISKWDYRRGSFRDIFIADGCEVGSRNAPMGYGDILGDWREEVWYVDSARREIRIYITTIPASTRHPTLMQDPIYRLTVSQETVGYMQSTQLSYYLGPISEETAGETSGAGGRRFLIPPEIAWIIPLASPFIIGLLLGLAIKRIFKPTLLIIVLAIILATLLFVSISFQDIYESAMEFLPKIINLGSGLINSLPYILTSFLVGLALGLFLLARQR